MQSDSVAIIASAAFGFASTVITQYYLSRKDRLALILQAREQASERHQKLVEQEAALTARVAAMHNTLDQLDAMIEAASHTRTTRQRRH